MSPKRGPRMKHHGARAAAPEPDHTGVLAVPCPSCDATPGAACRFELDQADDGTLRTVEVPPHVRRHLAVAETHP